MVNDGEGVLDHSEGSEPLELVSRLSVNAVNEGT